MMPPARTGVKRWPPGKTRLLAVEPQQVVPCQPDSADGWPGLETGVWPVPIVAVQPGREMRGALVGGVVDVGIGPLAQCGLDEAFGLPVDPGREGAGVAMAEAGLRTACVEGSGAVTPTVVGQHAADTDAEMLAVGANSVGRCNNFREYIGGRLVGVDLGKGHAGMVVHADMDVFPAGARTGTAAVVGNAVSSAAKTVRRTGGGGSRVASR